MDKHSSLIGTSVNYGRKSFITFAPEQPKAECADDNAGSSQAQNESSIQIEAVDRAPNRQNIQNTRMKKPVSSQKIHCE
jgi:hypothetical protein